ncbi:MAG: DUF4038 domain-containing protein [Thermomicrobiales bacterium]
MRTVHELEVRSDRAVGNPFADVAVDATFTNERGDEHTVPAFYDGDGRWRVRFSPDAPGRWSYHVHSRPSGYGFEQSGTFAVEEAKTRGYLTATPGRAWGFHVESGEPVFILGDTVYNLFGMAHCGIDVAPFLRRRAAQGFNLLRVRLPVSPFHPPDGYNQWQTRGTWPWGGSEQAPRFDRFNLDYFRTVDRVVHLAEDLGLGLEMIMEAWGFEFPFNSRQIFVPEWEELWLRYLIARYDAYSCVWIWTPMNEYEYYPNGDWHYKPVASRWAMRIARWIKGVAPHGHIVAMHNGPREPAFATRFAADPDAIDAIMFQEWGSRGAEDGWLAAGIEEQIDRGLAGWSGSAVFAEYGYERNPDLPLLMPSHEWCNAEHTRRGAWRGAFRGLGVVHGFENSWGPFAVLDRDQAGLPYLLHPRRFFTEVLPFHRLRPLQRLATGHLPDSGHDASVLASEVGDLVAVYFPTGGAVEITLPRHTTYRAVWFDPRTGETHEASPLAGGDLVQVATPVGGESSADDWVLALSAPSPV